MRLSGEYNIEGQNGSREINLDVFAKVHGKWWWLGLWLWQWIWKEIVTCVVYFIGIINWIYQTKNGSNAIYSTSIKKPWSHGWSCSLLPMATSLLKSANLFLVEIGKKNISSRKIHMKWIKFLVRAQTNSQWNSNI